MKSPLLSVLLLGFGLASGLMAQGGIVGTFPTPVEPAGNPSTPEKEMLGKILFWDEQLSSDNTMACGTCHFSESGGGDLHAGVPHPGNDGIFGTADDLFGSPGMTRQNASSEYIDDPSFGFGRQATDRNAPTMINAAFFRALFWDLRADESFEFINGTVVPGMAVNAGLESQVAGAPNGSPPGTLGGPPISSVEMAHDNINWTQITTKIFNSVPLKLATNVPTAMQTAITNANDSYTQLFRNAFPPANPGGPILVNPVTRERIAFAIAAYMRTLISDQAPFDLGTMSQDESDGLTILQQNGCMGCHSTANRVFSNGLAFNINLPNHARVVKTPTLRNMGLRKRFMHSGQFASVDECLDFYNQEIPGANPNFPFNPPLNDLDRAKVKAFLENALTDPRVASASFPFDRPTMHSEVEPFGSNIYGAASFGSGGVMPTMIGHSPENVGNADFKIGIGNALGGTTAILGISTAAAPPGSVARGVPLHIDLTPGIFVGSEIINMLSGVGAGQGAGTLDMSAFTAIPALAGTSFFTQWFVVDPAGPQGFSSTSGAAYTIF